MTRSSLPPCIPGFTGWAAAVQYDRQSACCVALQVLFSSPHLGSNRETQRVTEAPPISECFFAKSSGSVRPSIPQSVAGLASPVLCWKAALWHNTSVCKQRVPVCNAEPQRDLGSQARLATGMHWRPSSTRPISRAAPHAPILHT
jgi:hypothetical protein